MVQKTKVYTIPRPPARPKVTHYAVWNTSPRVNGKLVLRPQALTYQHGVEREYTYNSFGPWGLPGPGEVTTEVGTGPFNVSDPRWSSLDTRALARFNGKLKKGGASLGVTLASWKQSREMISSRLERVHSIFDRVESNLKSKKKLKRPIRDFAQARASDVLETEFGWVPLVQDIHSALTTACDVPASPWVRARQSAPIQETFWEGAGATQFQTRYTWLGQAWTTISAQCVVSNPNLWLLNRLGLINPATVIWDLVPWSFVVNMFVNVNQVLSSFTDHAGLSFSNVSLTRSRDVTRDYFCSAGAKQNNYRGFTSSTISVKEKTRTVGSFPTPSLEFRVPELNWELAVIASSLLVQKIGRIERLARDISRGVNRSRYTE